MRSAVLALTFFLVACSSDPGGNDSGTDGGVGDGGSNPGPAWTLRGVTGPDGLQALSMAVGPSGEIGLAYFATLGAGDGGLTDYQLRYQELRDGELTPPQNVRVVQRLSGVSLAFRQSGAPAISYLGGDNATDTGGTSAYWLQSDAVIAYRSGEIWTEEVVTRFGNEANCPDVNSNLGFVVGINSALAFVGDTAMLAWRDGHYGAFTGPQDWNGSDLEFATGTPGSWTRQCVLSGAGNDQAWGAHIKMVIANGQPALASDQLYGTSQGGGQNLVFNRRQADGTWAPMQRPIETIGNTQTGPSLAYDATLGFAIAVVDHSEDALYFTRSVNDGVTWSEKDPVFQSGSGGWYPSLSVSPTTHDPSIAFYVCSPVAGIAEGSCPAEHDALMVTERIGGIWREETVDPAGGWHPQLAHLSDGRRVIAYRDPRSGALKLAIENP